MSIELPHSTDHRTVSGPDLILDVDRDGAIVLYHLTDRGVDSVGTFTDPAAAWAMLDEFDTADLDA